MVLHFPMEKNTISTVWKKKFSELKKLIEQFLQIEMFQKDESAKKVQYARAVARFEDLSFFENCLKKYKWKKEEPDFRGQKEYLEYFLIWQEWVTHPETKKYKTRDYPLAKLISALDGFYACAKVVYNIELLNRKGFLNESASNQLVLDFLHWMENQNSELANEVVSFGVDILVNKLEQVDKPLVGIEKKFRALKSKLPALEKIAFYTALSNGVMRIYLRGDKGQIGRLFDVYKLGLEEGIVIGEKEINAATFMNISNTAVLAGRYSDAEEFIIEYKRFLPAPFKVKLPKLCQAFSLFHQRKYKLVLDVLPRGVFFNNRFILIEKGLAVRSLYEKAKEDEVSANLFENEINSFEAFIGRSKVLSEGERARYLNFVYMMKRIMRLRMKLFIKGKDIQSLVEQLSKKANIFSGDWLKEKIEELK